MPFNNPVVGGTTLIREAIQSPDFVHLVSGWSINQDGTAEFAIITARGKIIAATIETAESGPRIVINPADNPTSLRFYPSGSDTNFSEIYSTDGDFPNEATLHLRTGQNNAGTAYSDLEVAAGAIVASVRRVSDGSEFSHFQVAEDNVQLYKYAADGTLVGFLGVADNGTTVIDPDGFLQNVMFAGSWNDLSLQSGYSSPAFGYFPQWRWASPKTVELRGAVQKNTGAIPSNTQFANMPAAAFPASEINVPIGVGVVSGEPETSRLEIFTGGALRLQYSSVTRATGPDWISLDGVRYDIA